MSITQVNLPPVPSPVTISGRGRGLPGPLTLVPLAAVLLVQVMLTVRLLPYVGGDHADEAIYIYGGHQLIFELLHGGGSPYYETWYSGAPVIYPVIAALADHFGGVTLARLLSLVFMLTATILLFFTGRRLFGHWVGLTSAGLFAGLGITQNLGAMATYDAISLMMVAAAAYCATRSLGSTRWFLLIPLALLIANATKYVTVLFDPIVIGIAAIQLAADGWRRVWQRVTALGATTFVVLAVAMFLAGTAYFNGIMATTIARKGGNNVIFAGHVASTSKIVSLSWEWTGVIIALGLLALLVALPLRGDRRRHLLLLMLLIFAGLLVTLGNIRLHTDQSMNKHDDFGIWFACMPAAYALAHLADAARAWRVKVPVLILAVGVVIGSGYYYSQFSRVAAYFSTQRLAAYETSRYGFLGPYLRRGNEEYLLGSVWDSEMVYDNNSKIAWWQFFDDTYVKYPIPGRGGDSHGQAQGLSCGSTGEPPASDPHCMYLEGLPAYVAGIRAHWFALVTLDGNHGLYTDKVILETVKSTPGYILLTRHGGAPTYIYAQDYSGPGATDGHPPGGRSPTMAAGSVTSSNRSAVMWPSASAASRKVVPSRSAWWAISAALS